MGNRGNFDDDFDFDDNLFDDDDDLRGDDSDFNFDDDAGFGDDDDFGGGFDDEDDFDGDFDGDDEEEEAGGGPSRVFIILALLVTLLIIGGIAALLLLANRDTGPSEIEITSTAIAEFNATQQVFAEETATQSVEFAIATETAEFLGLTATIEFELTATAEFEFVATQEAITFQQTSEAISVQATQEAVDALATEMAQQPVDLPPDPDGEPTDPVDTTDPGDGQSTPIAIGPALTATALALLPPDQGLPTETPSTGLSASDVLLTATALSQTLSPPVVGTDVPGEPTRPGVFPTATLAMPQSGLFDDMTGSSGVGTVFLLAIGLIGVIAASRRLRR